MKNRMRAKSSSSKRQLTLLAEIALLFMIAIAIGATIAALSDSIDDGLVEERISGDFRSENEQGEYAGFILPDSDSRYYSKEELDELPTWDLYLAHNEIYARHGRKFDREDLAAYFASCDWYEPLYSPEEFDAMPSPLNEFEQKNSEVMAELRRGRNDPNL